MSQSTTRTTTIVQRIPANITYCPFLCPFSLCCFMTVRAATSSARSPYRPLFSADSLMCSYWRCSFSPTPFRGFFLGIAFHSFFYKVDRGFLLPLSPIDRRLKVVDPGFYTILQRSFFTTCCSG